MIQRGEERPTEFVAVSALPHVILVVFWIWNYVTNVYTAIFVSAGLLLAVGAYLLKERESGD